MSKPFFTEKDFTDYKYHEHERPSQAFARMCNEKLEKALGAIVYGDKEVWSTEHSEDHDTHLARLFNIEEIKKCVEHEPKFFNTHGFPLWDGKEVPCKHCGKKLKAKWEEAGE